MNDAIIEPRPPYEPPMIEDVPLRPEEQLLAGCKSGAGGPNVVGGLDSCSGVCTNIAPS